MQAPTDNLTLAIWQCAYAADTSDALLRLDSTAAQARASGADMLICPEMSLTGYGIGPERVARLAETSDGPLARAVGQVAQRHGLAIVYGYPERNDTSPPFNAVQFLAPDGSSLANYRKTHLFGETDRTQFSAGNQPPIVFTWRSWRLGLLICYDVEFPETARLLALQGADAVLVPTANMIAFDEVPQLLVPARACENQMYVAYANACGEEPGLVYGGLSTLASPQGDVLAQARRGESLLYGELQRSTRGESRSASQLPHRRVDLYAGLMMEPFANSGEETAKTSTDSARKEE